MIWAWFGGWLGRIGGWLALAAGALAVLWVRDRSVAKQATQQQEIRGAETRRKVEDDLARTPDAARTDELQRWER